VGFVFLQDNIFAFQAALLFIGLLVFVFCLDGTFIFGLLILLYDFH